MTQLPGNRDPLALWQEIAAPAMGLSTEEIRRRAGKLESTIRARNLRELAAFVIVVVVFSMYAVIATGPIFRAGCALIIVGGAYVMWKLFSLGGARRLETSAHEPCLSFHRRELERQRDLLKSVWRWYLAPLVPGLVVFQVGMTVEQHVGFLATVLVSTLVLATFVGVFFLNQWAAAKLERQIDELTDAAESSV